MTAIDEVAPSVLNESGVKRAGVDDAWGEPWYIPLVLQGLRNDGLSAEAADWIAQLASIHSPANLPELVALVRAQPPSSERDRAALALAALSEVVHFNLNRYRRLTAEDERVTSWPNNQRTKAADPDFYFDIYTDLPYRNLHRFITHSTAIGSAGSCFALRIAHQLQAWNYNYVIEEDDLPPNVPLHQLSQTSFRMAPARCGTLFNTPSMRQMIERGFGLWEPDKFLVRDGARLLDPFRSINPTYDDEAGFLADFDRHSQAIGRALRKCDVFIFTLGLTEAWRFAHSGDYTSIAPYKIDPALVRPHNLSVSENIAELERMFDVYRRHKPGIKFIISVSPVPLMKTFSTTEHVVAANSLSKATLRVAADEFCRNHPGDVYYLPSYEVVTSGTANPWEADMRHVSAPAVERVMQLFRTMFLVDQSSPLAVAAHEEVVHKASASTVAKGLIKAGLRKTGLYRRK